MIHSTEFLPGLSSFDWVHYSGKCTNLRAIKLLSHTMKIWDRVPTSFIDLEKFFDIILSDCVVRTHRVPESNMCKWTCIEDFLFNALPATYKIDLHWPWKGPRMNKMNSFLLTRLYWYLTVKLKYRLMIFWGPISLYYKLRST